MSSARRSRRHFRRVSTLPLVLALTGMLAGVSLPLDAQRETATLMVAVQNEDSGQPLNGVQVSVRGTGVGGLTDREGTIRFTGLPPGQVTVQVRSLGFREERRTVLLRRGRFAATSFALEVQPVALAPVTARVSPRTSGKLSEFYRRKGRGMGHYIPPEEVQRRNAPRFSDLLRRVPGLRFDCRLGGCNARMARSSMGNRRCPVQYYLDGVPVHGMSTDEVNARDIEAVEVYRGTSQIPPELNRGTALCGVIVVWTRDPARRW